MPLLLQSPPFSCSSSSSLFLASPFSSSVPRSLRIFRNNVRSELSAAAPALPVLSFSGDKVGEAFLDLRFAPPDTARAVVHRGIVANQQNSRRGTASTLTRGEVSGGGKKPYPQKKTGRARRGSQRTPLRPGGGVIFGPKPRDWSIKINRKEKRLAMSTAIASAAAAADAVVVEDFGTEFESRPRTKEFVAALRRWGLDPKRKSMFLMMDVPDNVRLSCRNIGTVKMLTPRTLNLFDVLDAEKLVFTRAALEYLNSIYGESGDIEEEGEEEREDEVVLQGL